MDPLEALGKLALDWAPTPDDVWRHSPYHVDGMHGNAAHRILSGINAAATTGGPSPMGIAVQGQRGAGKTHLLGWVREQVRLKDGYFFLVTLYDGVDYWLSVLHCVLDGLTRINARPDEQDNRTPQDSQLKVFLRDLAKRMGLPASLQDAVAGNLRLSTESMDIFVDAFRSRWPQLGIECHDTVRALILRASANTRAVDVGYAYLQGREETEPGERGQWRIQSRDRKPPQWLIREIFRLLALTGPSVVAVDQIDAIIARYGGNLVYQEEDPEGIPDDRQLNMIAAGLMDLREVTSRTLCVVACLPQSWDMIRRRAAVNTAADRFRDVIQLRTIPSAEVGEAMVAKRLTVPFGEIGFVTPYPTWPVKREAFVDAVQYTPRALIQRVDAHITECLNSGVVRQLERLDEEAHKEQSEHRFPRERSTRQDASHDETDLSTLDKRFKELVAKADVSAALTLSSEDDAMPVLLSAALASWIDERGDGGHAFSYDPPPRGKGTLHGRLRRTLNEELEDEMHWSFRAIANPNAVAALTRLRAACGFAGIHDGSTKRRLFVLRNTRWSGGDKTQEALEHLRASGGRTLTVAEKDLAVFEALRQMRDEHHPGLTAWLADRTPASKTRLLSEALSDAAGNGAGPTPSSPKSNNGSGDPGPPGQQEGPPSPRPQGPASIPPAHDSTTVQLGVDTHRGVPILARLESLRKHAVIFAGSGSGKTVFIRRLVESCALQGVSSIVLDPNNDLARLGDAWPEPPAQWAPGDAARAKEYLANTDVVVWTPGRLGGRPIGFQPLPDFVSVREDPDELAAAVEATVATLAPRAKVDGRTVKAERGRAVLKQAVEYFARERSGGLDAFVRLLADLPRHVSGINSAAKLAAEMSDTLTAAMVNDPLFGGSATPVDPGLLLTPPPGKRARVSVISLVGLPSDEQRQSFVNQLQMALFAWIKKHPAGDRPLGGLFVMDEAQTLAPSGAMTACTQSTIALSSQARKYGLGLVYATQAPKALHNRISGNAAMQVFGFLNSMIQINAAKELAQAKGSAVPDISRLDTGQFYVAGEGLEFQKIKALLCLSYHPKSPLTVEEVIIRARR